MSKIIAVDKKVRCNILSTLVNQISDSVCFMHSSQEHKNRGYCVPQECSHKSRVCPDCLKQGVELAKNNACSVNPKTGRCWFHDSKGGNVKRSKNDKTDKQYLEDIDKRVAAFTSNSNKDNGSNGGRTEAVMSDSDDLKPELETAKKSRGKKLRAIEDEHTAAIEEMLRELGEKGYFDESDKKRSKSSIKIDEGVHGKEKKINRAKRGKKIEDIRVDLIDRDLNQPRKIFSPTYIKELSDSIFIDGLIQPIIIRKTGKRFKICAGECRWRAHKLLELETIPAIIVKGLKTKTDKHYYSTVENQQREDMLPIENSLAIRKIAHGLNLNLTEAAKRIKKPYSWVVRHYALLTLPLAVIALMEPFRPKKEAISLIVGNFLAKLPRHLHITTAQKILKDKMKGDEAREYIRIVGAKHGKQIGVPRKPSNFHASAVNKIRSIKTATELMLNWPEETLQNAFKGRPASDKTILKGQIRACINKLEEMYKKL